MLRSGFAAGAALLAILGTPAFAQSESGARIAAEAASGSAAVGVADDDRLVCKSVRYTGSRFPERTCKTKKQVRMDQEASRKSTDHVTSDSNGRIGRAMFGEESKARTRDITAFPR